VRTLAEVLQLAANATAKGWPVGVYIETKGPAYHDGIGLPLETKLVDALAQAWAAADVAVILQSFEMEVCAPDMFSLQHGLGHLLTSQQVLLFEDVHAVLRVHCLWVPSQNDKFGCGFSAEGLHFSLLMWSVAACYIDTHADVCLCAWAKRSHSGRWLGTWTRAVWKGGRSLCGCWTALPTSAMPSWMTLPLLDMA
jgi:hypothetical protein